MSAETRKIESMWPDDADQELKSAIRLPDGSEFSSWEVPCTFSRTWITTSAGVQSPMMAGAAMEYIATIWTGYRHGTTSSWAARATASAIRSCVRT